MVKTSKISLLFFLIFLLGILGVMAYVDYSLDHKSPIDFEVTPQAIYSPPEDDIYF